jgi:uncharacterized protein (TIGR02118 family)
MIKWVAFINRPASMNSDEFRRWWFDGHAPMAKELPGLKKYVISLTVGTWQEEPKYDGIAELWFESMDTLNKALDSPLFTKLRSDLKENRITVSRIFTEEYVILDSKP